MAKLRIGDRTVTVDDAFLSLSPEEQNAAVEEIATSLGIGATSPEETKREEVSALTAVGRGAADAATVGLYDEARGLSEAGGTAPDQPMRLWDMIKGAGGLLFGDEGAGERYASGRDTARENLKQAQEDQPVATIGGQLVGGLALPVGGAAAGVTRGAAALNAAKAGATYGAAYGMGSGEGAQDRLERGLTGGLIGGAAGGVLGAVMPRGAAPGARNEVTDAAERLGVQLPRAVATESMALQRAGATARNIPFAGDPLVKASERAIQQIGGVADDAAARLGATSPATAGATARRGIEGYAGRGGTLSGAVGRAYDAVDNLIPSGVQTPLRATQGEVAKIMAERQSQRISDPGRAVSFVSEAIKDPKGLTYEGIKGLRTRIGEMLDDPRLMPAETSQKELQRIYGALSQDLKSAVAAGGQRATKAFERANTLAKLTAQRRENLQRIVGANSDEAVLDRIVGAASSRGRADIRLLSQARKAIGKQGWDEIAGTTLTRLGRDAEGNFSAQRFITDYGKLSPEGKALLFGSTGRREVQQALDDLVKVSSKFRDLQKFANPSGTGQAGFGGVIGFGAAIDPITTLTSVVGGRAIATLLARPATAKGAAQWAKAYEMAVRKPAAGTVKALQVASRQFAATIGREMGLSPNELLPALQGAIKPRAGDDGPDAERVRDN